MRNSGKKSNMTAAAAATATGTGISRLVSNLQTLPKRKSLLVIETGFPTSLVDLFIKSTFSKEGNRKTKANNGNSDKNSKRKKKIAKSGSAIPPTSIRTDPSVAPAEVPPGIEAVADRRDSCEPNGHGIEYGSPEDADAVSGSNRVVFAVFKVFLAAVLALGTEKLTTGITVSAFLLLFLEYLGKRLSRFLRRVPTDPISESVSSSSSSSSCAFIDEIDTVGDPVVSGGEIHQLRLGSDVSKKGEDWCPRRGGKKLRSNIMKRLIPRKLHRGGKKGKGEPEKCTELEAKALSASPCEETKDQSKSAHEPLQESPETVSDGGEAAAPAAAKRLRKGGSGYLLLVLLLIVIAGLFWGRILAFLLAIGWCLLLKFVELFSPPPLEA